MMHIHEVEELEYELGAAMGDPRKCPRHPNQVTSSRDGMHDCPCPECEYEMECADREENESPAHDCNDHGVTNVVGSELVTFCSACDATLSIEPDPEAGTWPSDDEIPF